MIDMKNITRLADQQLTAATSFGAPLLEGMATAFRMQADYLQRCEALTGEVLQRRRAGCVAALHLIERLRTAPDPSAVLQAEQEWAAGATQRLMADATCWQTAGMALLNQATTQWLQTSPAVLQAGPRRPDKAAA